jgi:thiamine transport system substrate-binding protein
MYPAAKTAKPLPKGFETLNRPARSLLMTSAQVGAKRKAWIEEWRAALAK